MQQICKTEATSKQPRANCKWKQSWLQRLQPTRKMRNALWFSDGSAQCVLIDKLSLKNTQDVHVGKQAFCVKWCTSPLCNTPICLWLATHRASSCGTHRAVTHSRKMRSSVHGTSHVTSPVFCNSKEACSEEQETIVSRRWSARRNGCVFWTVVTMHVQRNTFCSVSFLTWAIVV